MIKVDYIQHVGTDLTVVNAARISFANESQELTGKDAKLIKYLADNQHMSPFEHNMLTVRIECPLFIRSQIHRHRTFAYNEVSRRYTSEAIKFYVPKEWKKQAKSNRQASDGALHDKGQEAVSILVDKANQKAYELYSILLDMGVSREQARMVLPQSLMTSFYMSGNLRNWVHFIQLRDSDHAQEESRLIARQVRSIIMDKWPESGKALFGG